MADPTWWFGAQHHPEMLGNIRTTLRVLWGEPHSFGVEFRAFWLILLPRPHRLSLRKKSLFLPKFGIWNDTCIDLSLARSFKYMYERKITTYIIQHNSFFPSHRFLNYDVNTKSTLLKKEMNKEKISNHIFKEQIHIY